VETIDPIRTRISAGRNVQLLYARSRHTSRAIRHAVRHAAGGQLTAVLRRAIEYIRERRKRRRR
jgi:Flp pilus assembly protein TadB